MNSIKEFNPRRFFLLIRNDLYLNRSYFLIFFGVVTVILLFISTMAIIMPHVNYQAYHSFYMIIVFWGGLVMTERIFKSLHDDVKGPAWLTLPASTLEKFVGRLTLLTVLFPMAVMTFIFLLSLILKASKGLFIGSGLGVFNPFDKNVLYLTAWYIVVQSPFLLGATYFKRNQGPLTFLAIVGYILLSVLMAHVFYIAIYSHFSNNFYDLLNPGGVGMIHWIGSILNNHSQPAYKIIYWVQKVFFWLIIAPVCWVTGYFRLKEKEI
ncbi:MAG: hypothetical protein JW944_10670 [Deltaproteobacteria bacterium]|nr:hypothetical protein [Deltaproteobacteria bacterium]